MDAERYIPVNSENPFAYLHMDGGAVIAIELLADKAPNTVNAFIWAASRGFLDEHAIQRIVPGKYVDLSYDSFGHEETQYLIPWEYKLHPEIEPIESFLGCACMGGYGDEGEASCELFFPLQSFPNHTGIYPVFGIVREGLEEVVKIAELPNHPVEDFPVKMTVNEPDTPQIIRKVTLDLKGRTYPDPIRQESFKTPVSWTWSNEKRKAGK